MSKTIVIIGVTGIQGSSVANTFLLWPEWRVRGITRNTHSLTSQNLADKGVEMIKADIDDPQSLVPAFEGATVIFSNTDFFTHLQYALTSPDRWHTTDEITKYAYDREVTQGINIAKVAALPLVLRTLERFIYSSLCDVRKWSQGKYTTVHHYNSKTDTIRAIEAQFPDLAARMSTVQLGHYVTMWKAFPSMAPLKQPNGSFLMTRQVNESLKFPFVVAHRDTGSFVKALVDLPPKKDLLGVSETLTWPEWMAIWGDVLGVEAGFQQVSKDDFFRDVPQALRKDLEDTYDFIEEFGFTGGDPAVLTPEELDFPIPLTSMEDYIRSEDWASVLNA